MSDNEGYKHFMRPEPRENLGPIRLEHDKIFGRRVKTRMARIGMLRNAAEERKKEVKVFLEPFPHIRVEKAKDLQGWYKGKYERKTVRPRPCYTEALLTEPYGGYCPVGCVHCYINSGVRGYRATGLVTVPMNYGEQIEQQLSRLLVGSAGYLTSFHDPFNPLEEVYHNSQEAGQAFIDVGLPIFYLSRLKYPDWAVEQLRENQYSYAQKSMNTCNEDDWAKMSPGAASLEEHLKDIRRFKKLGIYTSIQVNPVIPGVTSNGQIVLLFKQLAKAGANHVIVKFVEAAYSWVPTLFSNIERKFGEERAEKFRTLFTQNIGGEKTVDEEYRVAAHKQFSEAATKLGMTYAMCYEYKWKQDAGGLDKTGISLGPEFTTAAQCHGQRVPMHYRKTPADKFVAFEGCPPSGCLYCEEQGTPCGNDTLGNATALRLPMLWRPMK